MAEVRKINLARKIELTLKKNPNIDHDENVLAPPPEQFDMDDRKMLTL